MAVEPNRIFPWAAVARTNALNTSRTGEPMIKLGCLSTSYLCMRFWHRPGRRSETFKNHCVKVFDF